MRFQVGLHVAAVVVALGALACEPTDTITVINGTDRTLYVDATGDGRDEFEDLKFEPGQRRSLGFVAEEERFGFVAATSGGEIVFNETFTEEQLKQMDWRVVINGP